MFFCEVCDLSRFYGKNFLLIYPEPLILKLTGTKDGAATPGYEEKYLQPTSCHFLGRSLHFKGVM